VTRQASETRAWLVARSTPRRSDRRRHATRLHADLAGSMCSTKHPAHVALGGCCWQQCHIIIMSRIFLWLDLLYLEMSSM